MADWAFLCANCRVEIGHSHIDDRSLLNYFEPINPPPTERFEATCSKCSHRDTYGVQNLFFRPYSAKGEEAIPLIP